MYLRAPVLFFRGSSPDGFTRGQLLELVSRDGLDLSRLTLALTRDAGRCSLNLRRSKSIVMILTADEFKKKLETGGIFCEPVSCPGANLYGLDLFFVSLPGAQLPAADLRQADLEYADLSEANLALVSAIGVKLSGADLSQANLAGGYFAGADFSGANLARANLSYASLAGADLRGANLSSARFSACIMKDVRLNKSTKLDGADLSLAIAFSDLNHSSPIELACGRV